MKAAAIESTPGETRNALSGFIHDLIELVKARLTLLVLLTAAAAAGAAALNQWWEYKLDALMHRTRSRPVPAGRMRPVEAVIIGSVLSIFGVLYLAVVCNALSAALAAVTIIIYIFAYTPLK